MLKMLKININQATLGFDMVQAHDIIHECAYNMLFELGRETVFSIWTELPVYTGRAHLALKPYYDLYHIIPPISDLGEKKTWNYYDGDPVAQHYTRDAIFKDVGEAKYDFKVAVNDLIYFEWNDTTALGTGRDKAHNIKYGLIKDTPWNVGSIAIDKTIEQHILGGKFEEIRNETAAKITRAINVK
jgi:hypothetical protein